jgi:hypothetical protein
LPKPITGSLGETEPVFAKVDFLDNFKFERKFVVVEDNLMVEDVKV